MGNLYRATMGGGSDIEPYIVIVTLNEDFKGQTVTLEQSGQDTLRKTCPNTAPYEVEFKPMKDGVWVAKSTTLKGKQSVASTEPLLEWGTYTVELKSEFDFETWLTQGRVAQTFATLDDVLADEKTIRQLMTVHDSVDFLANNISEEEAPKIFNNDLCAKWINLRDYALDTLYANAICKVAMDTADKYFYGEWALMPQVPVMTSDTAPVGEVSINFDVVNSRTGYKAFDGVNYFGNNATTSTYVANRSDHSNKYIQYKFPSKKRVDLIKFGYLKATQGTTGDGFYETSCKIQVSNDGINFDDLTDFKYKGTEEYNSSTAVFDYFDVPMSTNTEYQYYRVLFEQCNFKNASGYAILCPEIQMYLWQPKGNVPIMTANDAPYGVAKAKSVAWEGSDYIAFNGKGPYGTSGFPSDLSGSNRSVSNGNGYNGWYLEYKFNNPIKVKKMAWAEYDKNIAEFVLTPGNGLLQNVDFKLLASNDGVNYETIHNGSYRSQLDTVEHLCEINSDNIDNDEYYLYYRIEFNDWCYKDVRPGRDTGYAMISYLQFYGRELSVSIPAMTSNTEPYGEASASVYDNANMPWKAFDKVKSVSGAPDKWSSGRVDSLPQWIQYRFNYPTKILKFFERNVEDGATYYVKTATIQASNDGIEFDDLDEITFSDGNSKEQMFDIHTNGKAYLYYRVCCNTTTFDYAAWFDELNFYGLDYSERDFAEVNPSKYIYDHGVELETISNYIHNVDRANNNIIKETSEIIVLKMDTTSGTDTGSVWKTDNAIEMAPTYKRLRTIMGNSRNIYRADITSRNFYGGIMAKKTFSGDGPYVEINNINNMIPNHIYLDVSTIDSACVWGLFTTSGSPTGGYSLKEIWLER